MKRRGIVEEKRPRGVIIERKKKKEEKKAKRKEKKGLDFFFFCFLFVLKAFDLAGRKRERGKGFEGLEGGRGRWEIEMTV